MKKHFISLLVIFILLSTSLIGISTQTEKVNVEKSSSISDGGLMNSSWPMQSHDIYHTGRSPYSTTNNFGVEIWNYPTGGPTGSMSIDNDGSIYIGADGIYALNPNGTLKWKYITYLIVESAPAIDEKGIIYFGTTEGVPSHFYALYPNGTLKWEFPCGSVFCSPVVAADGTIIFADSDNSRIYALNPNGTEKWVFHANMVIYSSPAIGLDGTVFFGSHDCNVYALYPNNGTLRWKFTTGDWVHGSPTIGDDGTLYIGSDDGYLYALYPSNGTMKWKCHIGACYASPALDKNGILYIGVWEKEFYAIYPNGTIKWRFNPGAKIWGSSAAISDDGTIYFGTCDLESSGGIEIIALNINGTIKWRENLDTTFSSPAIGEDGTVYIGSNTMSGGYIHAYGYSPVRADANGPYTGDAEVSIQFTGTAFGGIPPYTYHWDFGDGQTSEEQNPSHAYINTGIYNATFIVTDSTGNQSKDTTVVTIYYPPPKIIVLKPRRALYLMDIPVCPFLFPVIIGPIAIKALVVESAPPGTVRISHVDFEVGGDVVKTFTHPPYRWLWYPFDGIKKNVIDIIAYDTAGRCSRVTINVLRLI
jgi:outer membrane protein assembly factor BamB